MPFSLQDIVGEEHIPTQSNEERNVLILGLVSSLRLQEKSLSHYLKIEINES